MFVMRMFFMHPPVHNTRLWQAAYLYAPPCCGEQLVDHIKLLQMLRNR